MRTVKDETEGSGATEVAWTWTEHFIPSHDGTELHLSVLRPSGMELSQPTPVILSPTAYGNHAGPFPPYDLDADGPSRRWQLLWDMMHPFDLGYTWVTADLRGLGGSQGSVDSGGDGDRLDIKTVVEWCSDQEWSTGRVGMIGMSYDAWAVLMGLAAAPRGLVAAVVISPLRSAYSTLYLNRVPYHYLMTAAIQAVNLSYAPASRRDSERYRANVARRIAANSEDHARLIAELVTKPDPSDPFWVERDLVEAAGSSEVPVMWSHGFWDTECHADNILPIFSRLRGVKRGWFGHWAHEPALISQLVGRPGFLEEMVGFFDRYLMGGEGGSFPGPGVTVQDNQGRWREEEAWPAPDTAARLTLSSGSYRDEPGNGAHDAGYSGRTGVGIWSVGPVLHDEFRLSGIAALHAEIEPLDRDAHLFAIVYDVAPDGQGHVVARGATVIGAGTGVVNLELLPTEWVFTQGHRVAALVTGAEDVYWLQRYSGQEVTVTGGWLGLPSSTPTGELIDADKSRLLSAPPNPVAVPDEAMKAPPNPLDLGSGS